MSKDESKKKAEVKDDEDGNPFGYHAVVSVNEDTVPQIFFSKSRKDFQNQLTECLDVYPNAHVVALFKGKQLTAQKKTVIDF